MSLPVDLNLPAGARGLQPPPVAEDRCDILKEAIVDIGKLKEISSNLLIDILKSVRR